MNLHDATVMIGIEIGGVGVVAACWTCDWWGEFIEHEDARRHAARHVALTAKGEGR